MNTTFFKIDVEAFTPWWSLLGGAIIGIATAAYILLTGRIVGIAGIFGNVLLNKPDHGLRVAFISAMLLCGYLVTFIPPSVYPWPPMETRGEPLSALPIGAVLVGLGSSWQHGCTSGHGVCGVSRLSPKSIVLLLTFMASGFVIAIVVRPYLFPSGPLFATPAVLTPFLETVPAILALCGLAVAFSRNLRSIGAFGCAMLFSFGVVIGGMATPSKIVGFLRVVGLGPEEYPGWDPSLLLVMAAAIAVAIGPVQYIVRRGEEQCPTNPLLFPDEEWQSWLQPKSWAKHTRKAQATLGALMFGAGWALTGLCPGPALVMAGSGSPAVILLFMPFYILGSYVGLQFQLKAAQKTAPDAKSEDLLGV